MDGAVCRMAESKTQTTSVDPVSFLEAVEHPRRRRAGLTLLAMMTEATGQEPRMWGPSIVGSGRYHYVDDSGWVGDAACVGFSPRKANLALYGLTGATASAELLARLGKHKRGVSCLYVNTLTDVDEAVLRDLVVEGYVHMSRDRT